ncbi:MAG: NAD(P)-dependent oxidoreductase [Deltaproteobacteria bacterium]|nr:NAD(P)-dependent oxidoreductase [Deltaproteobacteria bacterium]MBW2119433.1 NAD(P)-dependent oxidoreductase [Deltaproteobacteria bacterium]MBW2342550.1 NAD(P)-dependent oxidoreductase [Deltaproteobacteria bacterium]
MKILVTGATGFIGTHVVSILAKQGYNVIATSRNLNKAESYEWFSQIEYIPCDLSSIKKNYFQFFREPEILIHLAWEGLDNYKDLLHFERNLPVHYSFIKNMVCNGLRHVVVAGTCLEYGMQYGCLTEDLNTKPKVPYGLAKDTLRKNLEQLFNIYSVIFQWTRLFYLYGEGQSEKSLLSQLNSAVRKGDEFFNMSGGEQLRDYLPVEKAAQYIRDIALQNKVQGIINCCSGTPVSILRFVKKYLDEKGYSIKLNLGFYPYPDYEPMAFWGDNKKLQRVLSQL